MRDQQAITELQRSVLSLQKGARICISYAMIEQILSPFRESLERDFMEIVPGSETEEVLVEFDRIHGLVFISLTDKSGGQLCQ